MNLQGAGVLLYGALALILISVVAVLDGGSFPILFAVLALASAYASQLCSFQIAALYEHGVTGEVKGLARYARSGQLASVVAAATSLILSLWT